MGFRLAGLLAWALGVPAFAWEAANPGFEERVRSAMDRSVSKQKASVLRQAQTARAAPETASAGFFTVPWPSPPALVALGDCDPLPAAEIEPLIATSSARHAVKPELVRAIIRRESGGRPCAVSAKGAQGLMQLMPGTARELGVADVFDPAQNVDAGVRFVKTLLDRFKGELPLVLGAYNAGPGAVEREGGVPKNPETEKYVAEILRSLKTEE